MEGYCKAREVLEPYCLCPGQGSEQEKELQVSCRAQDTQKDLGQLGLGVGICLRAS